MFGGLNLKGGDDNNNKKDDKPAASASGFSFMGGGAAAAPAPAASSSSSGFSFMAAAAPSPATAATPSTSGFSFMSSASGAEATKNEEEAPAAPSSSSSGFSFLIPSPTSTEDAAAPETAPEPAPAISSSFDFLSGAAPSPASDANAPLSFQPIGQPAAGVKKKKKMRGQRVGLGVAGAPAAITPEPAAPTTAPPAASVMRDASDANRRAEAFMERMNGASSSPPPIRMTDSEDMVATAELAAREAKAQMAANAAAAGPKKRFTGFIKSLGGSSVSSSNQDPLDRSTSSSIQNSPAPTPLSIPMATVSSAGHYKLPSVSPALVKTTPSFPEPPKMPSVPLGMPKTPQDEFAALRATLAVDVHRCLATAQRAASQRKMLADEKFVATAKARLAAQQMAHAEAQLGVAAENEDYELAEQLSAVVDAHRRESAEIETVLSQVAARLSQLEAPDDTGAGLTQCFETFKREMAKLEETQKSQGTRDDTDALQQFANTSKQLSAENERLQQDLKHLERDEGLVKEERNELETAISEQSGEFERQRDATKAALDATEREIEDLRKLLVEKQKEAAKLRTDVYGLDDSISKVRVKFSRQLTRVQKKETAIQENRREWQTEQATFERHKEAHERTVETHSQALLAHDQLLSDLKSELELADTFAELVSNNLGEAGNGDENSPECNDDELAGLQATVVKCEAAANEAKLSLKAATTALQNLESEESTLQTRIPELEATKKAAAAKRDFKAASKASKAIKDATARLEGMADLKEEAARAQSEAQSNLKSCDAALVEASEVAKARESASARTRMTELAEKIRSLRETRAELCAGASEGSVRDVGRRILDARIDQLAREGEALGDAHGGWEELVGTDDEATKEEAEPTPTKEEAEPTPVEEVPASAPEPEEPVVAPAPAAASDPGRIKTISKLVQDISDAEAKLNAAAEVEDYEAAAEWQETAEELTATLDGMQATDDELDQAMMLMAAGGDDGAEEDREAEPEAQAEKATPDDSAEAESTEAPAEEVAAAEAAVAETNEPESAEGDEPAAEEETEESPKEVGETASDEDEHTNAESETFVQVTKDEADESSS